MTTPRSPWTQTRTWIKFKPWTCIRIRVSAELSLSPLLGRLLGPLLGHLLGPLLGPRDCLP